MDASPKLYKPSMRGGELHVTIDPLAFPLDSILARVAQFPGLNWANSLCFGQYCVTPILHGGNEPGGEQFFEPGKRLWSESGFRSEVHRALSINILPLRPAG